MEPLIVVIAVVAALLLGLAIGWIMGSKSANAGADTVGALRLTLNGVTRPVTLQAQFIGAGPSPMGGKLNIGFSAKTKIKRSDFGISKHVPMVGDVVTLRITTEAHAK